MALTTLGKTVGKGLAKSASPKNAPAKAAPAKKTKRVVDAEDVNFRDMSTKEYNARTKAQDSKTGRKIAAGVGGATAVAVGASMMGGGDKKSSAGASDTMGRAPRIKKEEFLRMEQEDRAKEKATSAKPKSSGGSAGFNKAFKEARAAGLKTFDFGGKKFTTRYAEEDTAKFNESIAKIKEKNQAAFEKKIEEVNKLYKGGMAKAKKTKKK